MKTRSIVIILFFVTINTSVFSQANYNEAMYDYQVNYKKALADIIESDTALIKFYPANEQYIVTATVQKLPGEKFFNMASSDGKSKQAVKFALLKFNLLGANYQLYAYQLSSLLSSPEYKDNFFIPFTDMSSGKTSYGGGKYIDFVFSNIKDDGTLVIDFNKSYNPYCAFRAGYSCPIPPAENELPVEIKAGEMAFDKK